MAHESRPVVSYNLLNTLSHFTQPVEQTESHFGRSKRRRFRKTFRTITAATLLPPRSCLRVPRKFCPMPENFSGNSVFGRLRAQAKKRGHDCVATRPRKRGKLTACGKRRSACEAARSFALRCLLSANLVQFNWPDTGMQFDGQQRVRSLDRAMLPRVTRKNQTGISFLRQPDQFQHLATANLSRFIHHNQRTGLELPALQKARDCFGRRKTCLLHVHHLLTLWHEDDNAPA
jgi:hypothetical protein